MAPPAPSTTRSSPQRPRAPFAPRDIIRGPDGTLSVAGIVAPDDVSGGKIEEYRYDGEAGTAAFKPEIGDPGGLPSDLGGPHPQGLVFGPAAIVYVSARNIPGQFGGAILRFNPNGGAYLRPTGLLRSN